MMPRGNRKRLSLSLNSFFSLAILTSNYFRRQTFSTDDDSRLYAAKNRNNAEVISGSEASCNGGLKI